MSKSIGRRGMRFDPDQSTKLEEFDAQDLIGAALDEFGERAVVSTAFGPTGLVILDMAQRANPDVLAYTIDTGFLFDETQATIDRWTRDRRLQLETVLPILSPEEQAREYGDNLWERDPDRCCAMRKVEPNRKILDRFDLWIAALRRDESESRRDIPMLTRVTLRSGRSILKLAPLVRWTRKDVWRYIVDFELPYNPLHDRGYPSIGCTHCTLPARSDGSERAGRWSGRNKEECGIHLPIETE